MSRISINLQIDQEIAPELQKQVQEAAAATLKHERRVPASLSILITGDERIRAMNRDYRGFDESTDVLSFPFEPPVEDDGDYLGDIVVALPVAAAQANAAGHSLGAEVSLLVVHGVLHLLGYDHAGAEEKAAMWQVQQAVMAALGLERTAPTE